MNQGGTDELTILKPGWSSERYLSACWKHRELVWFLARRDLIIRYRFAAIGVAWVLLRPLASMLILTLIFGRIAKLDGHGSPYHLVVLCGLIIWNFAAAVTSESANSLVNNPSLITKVYFPRMALPGATLVLNTIDIGVNAALLLALLLWAGIIPGSHAFAVPAALALTMIAASGAGLWASALMAQYRDMRNIIPVVLQLGLLLSPVAYGLTAVPSPWDALLWLNPMAAPIELLRWSLLPGWPTPPVMAMTMSILVGVLLCFSGYRYFRRVENRLADLV